MMTDILRVCIHSVITDKCWRISGSRINRRQLVGKNSCTGRTTEESFTSSKIQSSYIYQVLPSEKQSIYSNINRK